jgi:hypothetical protein
MFPLERHAGWLLSNGMLHTRDSLGSIFQHGSTRAYFEDGLRHLFRPCYDPPPARISELLQRLRNEVEDAAADYYRTIAAQFTAKARLESDPAVKADYQLLVRGYTRLAEQAERYDPTGPVFGTTLQV